MKNNGSYSAEMPMFPKFNPFLTRMSKKSPAKAVIPPWFLQESIQFTSTMAQTETSAEPMCPEQGDFLIRINICESGAQVEQREWSV